MQTRTHLVRVHTRRVVVVASDLAIAERVGDQVMATGLPVIVTGRAQPEQAAQAVATFQAQAVLVEASLYEALRGTLSQRLQVKLVPFDLATFDALALARAVLDTPTSDAPTPTPTFVPSSYRVCVGLVGAAGGMGTTTLLTGMALAAARRGERTVIFDLAGGDTLPTLGKPLSRGVVSLSDNLTVSVAPNLEKAQAQVSDSAAFDVALIDLGKLQWRHTLVDARTAGALVYTVVTDDLVEAMPTSAAPLIINRARKAAAWRVAEEPALQTSINEGQFGRVAPGAAQPAFLASCGALMAHWLGGQP